MANINPYKFSKLTAGTVSAAATLNVSEFMMIKNLSANTLTLGIDNMTTVANYILVDPLDTLYNLPFGCSTLYYKADVAASDFEVFGLVR